MEEKKWNGPGLPTHRLQSCKTTSLLLLFPANNSACKCIFVTNGSVLRFLIIIIIMGFWKLANGSGNDNKGWEKTCCLRGECLWNSQWGWEGKLLLHSPQTPNIQLHPSSPPLLHLLQPMLTVTSITPPAGDGDRGAGKWASFAFVP